MNTKRNTIIICSDEHAPAISGYQGHPIVKTPHLDQLAKEGTNFSQAYCNSPVCGPSRMSFMTGKYAYQIENWFMMVPLNENETTWSKRLDDVGIKSTMHGKLDPSGPWQSCGFSDYKTLTRRPMWEEYPRKTPFAERLYGYTRDKWKLLRDAGIRDNIETDGTTGSRTNQGHYDHDRIVRDWSLDFIKNKGKENSDEPWVLYVGFLYPHWPYCCPEEYFNMYYPNNIELPYDFHYPNENIHPILQQFQKGVDFGEITDDILRRAISAYYGMITCMDDMIGEIMTELKNQNLYDNTNIIYTSDHGESLGNHGLFFKQCSYEPAVGVPLLVSGPDFPKNQVNDTPVSLVDLYPTMLDIYGLDCEDDRPGESWLPLINGEEREDATVFSEFHGNFLPQDWYMVKDKNYKLTRYQNGEPTLFDVKNDPQELNDLAKNKTEEVEKILAKMNAKMDKIVDTDKVSFKCKSDLGLIGENGEDYTETLKLDELKKGIEEGRFSNNKEMIRSVNGRFVGEY